MPITEPIIVPAAQFADAVAWVSKWRATKPASPIHAGILIESDGTGLLNLTAFDGDVCARTGLVVPGIPAPAAGRVIVSGALLAALAATFTPKGDVTLTGGTSGGLELTAGRWTGTLPAFAEDDWPTMPEAPATIGVAAGGALSTVTARVGVACGEENAKGLRFLTLMHLAFSAGGITLTGTNRYRVAQDRVGWKISDQPVGTAIPADATPVGAIFAAAAAAFDGPDEVEIGVSEYLLSLTNPVRSIVMPLGDPGEQGYPITTLDGNFAAGEAHEAVAVISVAEVAGPLRRAVIMRGKEGPVVLSFDEGVLRVAANEDKLDQRGTEPIDITYDEMPTVINVNPEYLADALNTAPAEVVTVRFEPVDYTRRPMLLTAQGHPGWRYCVIPVVKV